MRESFIICRRLAVTLLELLIVVLIVGILATVATGVYTGETRRAKIAATADLIRQLEIAITRYELDLGEYPPSGSGATLPPGDITTRHDGSGYLYVALVHSMSGNAYAPASSLWKGPYISLRPDQLRQTGLATATGPAGGFNILDAWRDPILYIQSADYSQKSGFFLGGTLLFSDANLPFPATANPRLPMPSPFVALGETYYNTSTYQLISAGPDGKTLIGPDLFPMDLQAHTGLNYRGAEFDDITNFGY